MVGFRVNCPNYPHQGYLCLVIWQTFWAISAYHTWDFFTKTYGKLDVKFPAYFNIPVFHWGWHFDFLWILGIMFLHCHQGFQTALQANEDNQHSIDQAVSKQALPVTLCNDKLEFLTTNRQCTSREEPFTWTFIDHSSILYLCFLQTTQTFGGENWDIRSEKLLHTSMGPKYSFCFQILFGKSKITCCFVAAGPSRSNDVGSGIDKRKDELWGMLSMLFRV